MQRLLFRVLASRAMVLAVARVRATTTVGERIPNPDAPAGGILTNPASSMGVEEEVSLATSTAEHSGFAPSEADAEDPERASRRPLIPEPPRRTDSSALCEFRPSPRNLLWPVWAAAMGATMLGCSLSGNFGSKHFGSAAFSGRTGNNTSAYVNTTLAPPFLASAVASTSTAYFAHQQPASAKSFFAPNEEPAARNSSLIRAGPGAHYLPVTYPTKAAAATRRPHPTLPTAVNPRRLGEGILDALQAASANRDSAGLYFALMLQRAYPKSKITNFFKMMAATCLLPEDKAYHYDNDGKRAPSRRTPLPGNSYRHFLESLPWGGEGASERRKKMLPEEEYASFVLPIWAESLGHRKSEEHNTLLQIGVFRGVDAATESIRTQEHARTSQNSSGKNPYANGRHEYGGESALAFFARRFGRKIPGGEPRWPRSASFLEDWYGAVPGDVEFAQIPTVALVDHLREPYGDAVAGLEARVAEEVDSIYPLFIEDLARRVRGESAAAVGLGGYLLADGDLNKPVLRVPIVGKRAYYFDEMKGPHTAVGVGVHGLSAVLPPGDRTTTPGTTAVRSSGTNSGQPSTAPPRAVRGLDSVIMASLVDASPGRQSRTTGSTEKRKTARPFLEEVRAKDSAVSFRLKERSVVSVGSSSSGNEESDRHHRTAPCLYDALFPVPPASPQTASPAFLSGEKRGKHKQEVKEGHRVRLPEIDRAYAFSVSLYPLEERQTRGESSARDGNSGEKPLHHSFLLLKTRADPGNIDFLSSAGGPTFYLFDSLEREFFLSPDIHVEGEYADVAPPKNSTEQTSFAGTRKVLWSSELALLGSPALRTLSAGTVRSLLCSAALLYVDEDLSQEWMPTLDSLAAFEASECAEPSATNEHYAAASSTAHSRRLENEYGPEVYETSGVVQEQLEKQTAVSSSKPQAQALDAWKDLWNSVIFRGELADSAEEGTAVVKPGRGLPVLRSVYELPIVA